ncbi:MAG: hypothetical protein ACTSU5_06040 [Promethearchaeota archaeon]
MVENKERSVVVQLPLVEAPVEVRRLTERILGKKKVAFVDMDEVDKILEEFEDRDVLVDLDGKYHDLVQLNGGTPTYLGDYILFDKEIKDLGIDLIELLLLHEKYYEEIVGEEMEGVVEKVQNELVGRLEGLYPETLEQISYELTDIIHHHLIRLCVNARLVSELGTRAETLVNFLLEGFDRVHPDYYQIDPLQLVGYLLNTVAVALLARQYQLETTSELLPAYEDLVPPYAKPPYDALKEHMRYLVSEPFSWDSYENTSLNVVRVLVGVVNDIFFGLHAGEFLDHVTRELGVDFEDLMGQVVNSFVDPFDEENDEVDYAFVNSVRRFMFEELYEAYHFHRPISWLDDASIVDVDRFWREFDEYDDYPEGSDEDNQEDGGDEYGDEYPGPFDL